MPIESVKHYVLLFRGKKWLSGCVNVGLLEGNLQKCGFFCAAAFTTKHLVIGSCIAGPSVERLKFVL
jgi:hypothetical protein